MNLAAVIQVRMSSERFPGKALADLFGRPVLGHLLDSLRQCAGPDSTIVATSREKSDDAIAAFSRGEDVPCFRGALDNVAERFAALVRQYRPGAFIRLSGDSPLFDYRIIEDGIRVFARGAYSIVTNVRKRTFPKGQSFEIIDTKAFLEALPFFSGPHDFEHVTPFFYRNDARFKIFDLEAGGDFSSFNLCVDEKRDLENIRRVFDPADLPFHRHSWRSIVQRRREAARAPAAAR